MSDETPAVCPYLAENLVERKTGPLPPDVFALHSHALYCAGTLFSLGTLLTPAPNQIFDPPRETQIPPLLKKLAESARAGKALANRLVAELISIRANHPFSFPRSREATAHQAVFDLATVAVVNGERNQLATTHTLPQTDHEFLLQQLTWEAATVANRRSQSSPEIDLPRGQETAENSEQAKPHEAKREVDNPFVPTPLQKAILETLNGRALKVEPLANEVAGGDKSRLYRKGGLKELKELDLVHHKHGVGYYRPDAPPK